jgi:pyruvate dehydrogenase (quinone)
MVARRPVVLGAETYPEARPLPPHIILEQTKKLSLGEAKGGYHTAEMVAGAARQLLSAVLPGRQS